MKKKTFPLNVSGGIMLNKAYTYIPDPGYDVDPTDANLVIHCYINTGIANGTVIITDNDLVSSTLRYFMPDGSPINRQSDGSISIIADIAGQVSFLVGSIDPYIVELVATNSQAERYSGILVFGTLDPVWVNGSSPPALKLPANPLNIATDSNGVTFRVKVPQTLPRSARMAVILNDVLVYIGLTNQVLDIGSIDIGCGLLNITGLNTLGYFLVEYTGDAWKMSRTSMISTFRATGTWHSPFESSPFPDVSTGTKSFLYPSDMISGGLHLSIPTPENLQPVDLATFIITIQNVKSLLTGSNVNTCYVFNCAVDDASDFVVPQAYLAGYSGQYIKINYQINRHDNYPNGSGNSSFVIQQVFPAILINKVCDGQPADGKSTNIASVVVYNDGKKVEDIDVHLNITNNCTTWFISGNHSIVGLPDTDFNFYDNSGKAENVLLTATISGGQTQRLFEFITPTSQYDSLILNPTGDTSGVIADGVSSYSTTAQLIRNDGSSINQAVTFTLNTSPSQLAAYFTTIDENGCQIMAKSSITVYTTDNGSTEPVSFVCPGGKPANVSLTASCDGINTYPILFDFLAVDPDKQIELIPIQKNNVKADGKSQHVAQAKLPGQSSGKKVIFSLPSTSSAQFYDNGKGYYLYSTDRKTAQTTIEINELTPPVMFTDSLSAGETVKLSVVGENAGGDSSAFIFRPTDVLTTELHVFGARLMRTQHGQLNRARLYAQDAKKVPLAATWQYENAPQSTAYKTVYFFDTYPEKVLIVSYGTSQIKLRPVNVACGYNKIAVCTDKKKLISWEIARPQAVTYPTHSDAQCVVASRDAFTALLVDGRVATWGANDSLCSGGPTAEQNYDFVQVAAGEDACSALRNTGELVVWGDPNKGGNQVSVTSVNNAIQLIPANKSMGAVLNNGDAIAWKYYAPAVSAESDNIESMAGFNRSYVALKKDGSPVSFIGSDTLLPPINMKLLQIIAYGGEKFGPNGGIIPWTHWVGLKTNGTLIGWTDRALIHVPSDNDLIQIVSRLNSSPLVALKADGSLITWDEGIWNCPDDSDFVQIASCSAGFAGLKNTGEIISWGSGEIATYTPKGTTWRAIYGDRDIFVALDKNGNLSCWNHKGNYSTPDEVKGIVNPVIS